MRRHLFPVNTGMNRSSSLGVSPRSLKVLSSRDVMGIDFYHVL